MPHSYSFCYEFGSYRLDLSQRVLTRAGEAVPLTPKATEILVLLVTNAGQLVEKEELLKEVWPNTFVEEANLTQNIFTLRRALGDERGGPRYIETVARRGYRFVATVRAISAEEDQASNSDVESQRQTANGESISPRAVLAVLPFNNTTEDQAVEYLADGLTDSIINNLSRVSRLRVMSRSAVFRYKTKEVDPQSVGRELGVDAVLVGTINSRASGLGIGVELVDVTNGWQLWGKSFDCEIKDILEIQDEITRQLLTTLRLKLTGDEAKRITARYTENALAYQSYLEGRYHWSRYTRKGIEKAIGHFRQAIELDPNYALAYAGIVDCYLRLATNYLPPEEDSSRPEVEPANQKGQVGPSHPDASDPKVKLRFEWDWKGAERELRRANELKIDYPAAHQWYAAYRMTRQLLERSRLSKEAKTNGSVGARQSDESKGRLPSQIPSLDLTPSEQVQVYCAIAREQIDAGNYEAACLILQHWWVLGQWPRVEGLNQPSCADLLFTCGELAGCVASARQLPKGQKYGEALLNGSIALFEQLGSRVRTAEARIELALCYYRQGLFDLGRSTLVAVLCALPAEDAELRTLTLIRLASLERHAGRLNDALSRLIEATAIVNLSGPWATGRCHLELASTYKDLAISEEEECYFDRAQEYYFEALYEFEAVGSHRLAAIVENNLGFLMLILGNFSGAESHLLRARRTFEGFGDKIRCAQVDDTLARLHLAEGRLEQAVQAIERAEQTMETGDEDALLAEALTTKGMIYCKLKRHTEAKGVLEGAYRLALRCGDSEGAGRALLVLIEEMCGLLQNKEREQMGMRLTRLLSGSQQASIRGRVRRCLEIIAILNRSRKDVGDLGTF